MPDQTEDKRSKRSCLTDSSPKDKNILRLLVHMGRFEGSAARQGWQKPVIAQRQILSLQPLSIFGFDGVYPKKGTQS
jgi:hypothetical protein